MWEAIIIPVTVFLSVVPFESVSVDPNLKSTLRNSAFLCASAVNDRAETINRRGTQRLRRVESRAPPATEDEKSSERKS
jgi:hypothetical protein